MSFGQFKFGDVVDISQIPEADAIAIFGRPVRVASVDRTRGVITVEIDQGGDEP